MRTVNMIYATHIPKRERKRALRNVYAMEPVAPKFNPWSSCPITFDRRDHPTSIRHSGFAALVLDPIIDGFHLFFIRSYIKYNKTVYVLLFH